MASRELLDLHCSSCIHLSSGKCHAIHSQPYVHSLSSCPISKWSSCPISTHSPSSYPILWLTQDFAQGGITSYITYAAQHLALSNTPVLAVLHESDFKYDHDRAKIIHQYCPTYRIGEEPQSLYSDAQIVTFSYFYSESLIAYLRSRLSSKQYHSVIYQAHGDCEFTRQSIANQKLLVDTAPITADQFWGMGPTPYSREMLSTITSVPIKPMYYGVDLYDYHIRNPRLFYPISHPNYSPDPIRFLCVGRLDPHKRYDLSAKLISEFRSANPSYPPYANARMTLVGDGWAKDQVLASLAPYSFVDYIPWLSTPDLVPVLQSHDALLMHSRSEGGPYVTLEALSCALPVHSSSVGISSHLSSLDPQRLIYDSSMSSLTDFVKRINSIESHTKRYSIIEQIRRLYSKLSLRFA